METELWNALVIAAFILGLILGIYCGFIIKVELDKMKVDDDNEVTYIGTNFERGKEKLELKQ